MPRPLLSTRKLNQIRRLNERAMPDSMTILTPGSETADSRGGVTQSFTEGDAVVGRFRPYAAKPDAASGERTSNDQLYQVTLPWDTVLTNKHRIRRGGIDYEIVGDVAALDTDGASAMIGRSFQVGLRFLVKKVGV